VPVEPRERWTSDPFKAEVRRGDLYGRGACDMKGGVAAMVLAAEVLAAEARLAGDLLVCTVTDEESSGAGGIAAVAHGVRADAGIVTEPTSFDVWVACRGTVLPTFVVEGRAAHAELARRHWRAGGAVNAIEKAGYCSRRSAHCATSGARTPTTGTATSPRRPRPDHDQRRRVGRPVPVRVPDRLRPHVPALPRRRRGVGAPRSSGSSRSGSRGSRSRTHGSPSTRRGSSGRSTSRPPRSISSIP
jgi:acetylornithine deacetylase/succinyl-diaminopimelate desuccinylase-like protein